MHRYPKREQKNRYTARLSPIISVLLIPIRVSDALGYARNNSECNLLVRISPQTKCKDKKKFGKEWPFGKNLIKK